jgi:hypothetical protein
MSTSDFVKGACRQCGGHIEFPANAAGRTINCPHCGQPTELVSPNLPHKTGGSGRVRLAIAMALCLAAAVPGVILLMQRSNRSANSAPSLLPQSQTNVPVAVAPPKIQPEEATNDFAIMPFKLEKTPGSSLVYVTGTIQNDSERQRFGVKVEFSLFDTNDNAIGTATDYEQVIEPHGAWRFKAMVIESKAVSAKFDSIAEEK